MNSLLRPSRIINSYKIFNNYHQNIHDLQYISSSGCFLIKCYTLPSQWPNNRNYSTAIIKHTTEPSTSLYLLQQSTSLNAHKIRTISFSAKCFEKSMKPSSKVEVTVEELKKKQSEPKDVATKPVAKKSITQKVKDEILHYYHGFRLLFIDMKISSLLLWRVLMGKSLSRREYRQLIRTVGDMFRLVPFSVFIIVPFMEFLLPVFIKFFPGMLPSTFQTKEDKEAKMKQSLKVKLDMAKFLQETLDNMTVQHKDRNSEEAKQFVEWFNKIRTSGEHVTNEEIMKYSKLFEDELTLDSLSRSQLIALCRVLEVQTLGTNNFLRFQLRMKLRSLAADDNMIHKEGVESMTLGEVQQACRARGMRAYGMSEERLRKQLNQWLDLSLNEKVPPSLLLLSRALMLPETIPTSDKLKATISALPEEIITSTKAAIAEKEGKIDNQVKIELLKEEERKIKEERRERREEKLKQEKLEKEKATMKEILEDKAPIITASSTPILEDTATRISAEKLEKVEKKEEQLQSKDIQIIETALDSIKDKKFILEKEEIEELKAQMSDYKEDVEDLERTIASQPIQEIKESKAAKRLYTRVNKMITKLGIVLEDLQKKEQELKLDLEQGKTETATEELLRIDDIKEAIQKIRDVPDKSRIDQIIKVLHKMDDDQDGSVKVEDVLKVIELLGKENVNLSTKQVDELIDLLDKEEILELEQKIEKALLKDKEAIKHLLEASEDKTEKMSSASSDNKSKSDNQPPPDNGGSKGGQPPKGGNSPKSADVTKHQTIIAPPPPSIDKPKQQDNSKTL